MNTVCLICDLSGSMAESGKRFIVRNLVRSVDQYFRLQESAPILRLVAWSNDTTVSEWQAGQDVPDAFLKCSGSSAGEALIRELSSVEDGHFMLFTDGYWPESTRKQIRNWAQSLPANSLRIIKVGEDADPRLKGPSVFIAEDLLAALEEWVA